MTLGGRFQLLNSTLLCLLFPLTLICSVFISQADYEESNSIKSSKTSNTSSALFKVQTKFHGQPDDLACVLTRSGHRKQWDMNMVQQLEEFSNLGCKTPLRVQYESYAGSKITESIMYDFLNDDETFYIVEDSVIDLLPEIHSYRLFVLQRLTEGHEKDCYSVTVFGELRHEVRDYKGEKPYVLDYVKGLVVYMDHAQDLPSSHELKCKDSFGNAKDEERMKLEGAIKITKRKINSELEQINESEELTEGEVEGFKFDHINMKDTLLTVDHEYDSEEYNSELQDNLYEEVDEILKTESDDLSLIKTEAINFDKRIGRFYSKDSFSESNELLVTQKSELEMENSPDVNKSEVVKAKQSIISPEPVKEKVESCFDKQADHGNIEVVNGSKSSGAVISPHKSHVNGMKSALGVSTVDLDTVSKRNFIKTDLNCDRDRLESIDSDTFEAMIENKINEV